jgi:hypothetical protein
VVVHKHLLLIRPGICDGGYAAAVVAAPLTNVSRSALFVECEHLRALKPLLPTR